MRKAAAIFSLAAVLILSSVTGAMAVSIVTDTTWSWECVAVCGGSNATSTAVSSLPSPWATPTTGTWISSVDSGTPGDETVLLNTQVQFSKAVDFGVGALLTLQVWADDTAQVLIDGVALALLNPGSAPNNTLDNACAAGVLGCEDLEFGQFSHFASGVHDLQIVVTQLVDITPFGTLAEGDLAPVPEPATILLLGSALAAAGVASRRRLKKGGSVS